MEGLINEGSKAWLWTNTSLFKHVLDYEAKLDAFLDKAGGWIRAQEEHIWMMMFQITGDTGAPLSASLDIVLVSWKHSPPFWPTLHTRAIHPSSVGLHPKLMPSAGWGFTAWILYTLCLLTAAGRPRTFWRRLSSAVQEVVQPLQWGQFCLPLPPQHPHSSGEMPKHSPWKVFPPLLPPQYALHPSADVPSPLLHTARGPARPLLARVWHLSADQEGVIQAHWVHQAQVLDLVVAVGPVMGPKLDPKPVQVRDLSTHEQHQMGVSKSSLEMKPVEARMMSWTLPMRQMCHKGVCPCLTSLPQMMRTLVNAKRMNLHAKVIPNSRHGKTNSCVKGWQAYKSGTAQWMTMLMVGREGPRILTP